MNLSRSVPGSCSVLGHTHVTTFDGKQYQIYPHQCAYTLAYHCHSGGPSKFTITLVNRNCDDAFRRCSQDIRIAVVGQKEIVIDRTSQAGPLVTVGGEEENSYLNEVTRVGVFSGQNVVVSVNIGKGSFELISAQRNIYFSVSPDLEGETCGLCGTFNRKANDDYHLRSGINALSVEHFLSEWRDSVLSSDSCPDTNLGGVRDYCNTFSQAADTYEAKCGILGDTNGPFKACFDKVSTLEYKTKCRDSGCRCEECFCDIIAGYAKVCADKGVIIEGWRNQLFECNRKFNVDLLQFYMPILDNTKIDY